MAGIGSLNESPLHAALKLHAAPPGSRFEVEVGGYVVDAVADDLLVEVQTRNLGAMRAKLGALLPKHRMRLVLPVADRRWIVKRHADGRIDRRPSPKRGSPVDLFAEMVVVPTLLAHPNFELELIERVGKRGNAHVYRIPTTGTPAASSAAASRQIGSGRDVMHR